MMVITAKVNLKKVLILLAAAAAVLVSLLLLFGGGDDAQTTSATAADSNDARVQFLNDLGWEVKTSPTESGQVKIPKDDSEMFSRYNRLQKSQGYDLTQYAGKKVMRYVYEITNYPDAAEPVYATLLVYKGKVIGGDVTDTSARGKISPLQKPVTDGTSAATQPSTEAATEATDALSPTA